MGVTGITIYNYFDEKWNRTQLQDVRWYGGQAVTINDKGLVSADTYTVRVPLAQAGGFLLPEEYEGRPGTWTLNSEDIIVKGLCEMEIARARDLSDNSQRFVVTGWRDNRTGSERVQHIRIEGK